MSGDGSFWHLAEGVTCHAWNKDRTKLAISPNSNEIWIYSGCQNADASQWRKEAVLTEVGFPPSSSVCVWGLISPTVCEMWPA